MWTRSDDQLEAEVLRRKKMRLGETDQLEKEN